MSPTAWALLAALLGLILAWNALRHPRRHPRRALLGGFAGLTLLLAAASLALLVIGLHGYRRLTAEQSAGELQFTAHGAREFDALLTFPDGRQTRFALRGDEWQVDARVLKWRALATLAGADTIYRLERIGGRYSRIADEQSLPRTVYALHPDERLDLWDMARRYHRWLPGVDALYGSAAFLPMADGARYAINVSPSGLVARPLNPAAEDAVSHWH